MPIIVFLTNLAGATMLLLFGVRLVRTGIERRFGATFKRLLTTNGSPIRASFAGLVLAVILQSSAAVAVLVTGFARAGLIAFPIGLALILGADFGSSLIIRVLSFELDWLIPLLLAVGGYLFVKTEGKSSRQFGRIVMGIAFILISLQFLRETVEPIRDSAFLPAISDYLEKDYFTAFIVGALLAFAMHSSVATILMVVTLVTVSAIPFSAGFSLILGANLGSAFIPIWLTRDQNGGSNNLLNANLALRGIWSLAVLFAVNLFFVESLSPWPQTAGMLIYLHIALNFLVVVSALPFLKPLEQLFGKFLPSDISTEEDHSLKPETALTQSAASSPQQALPALKRELLRMIDLVESMFRPTMELYASQDKARVKTVRETDEQVNSALEAIRVFVASLPKESFSKAELKIARSFLEYAIRLESAGDVAAKRLAVLADEMQRNHTKFSNEGVSELSSIHENILANITLASNVLISDDLESARLLSLEKTEIKKAEGQSRKRHLKRLQRGEQNSFDTSDIHLETLRAFREFNSHISAVAYPILYLNGQLLESRLISELPDEISD